MKPRTCLLGGPPPPDRTTENWTKELRAKEEAGATQMANQRQARREERKREAFQRAVEASQHAKEREAAGLRQPRFEGRIIDHWNP